MSTGRVWSNLSEPTNSTLLSSISEAKKFIWAYILPAICVFGILTNTLNITVFAKRQQLKNKIYKYFLAHSTIDLIYMLTSLSYFLIKYSLGDLLGSTYFTQMWELISYFFLTTALAMNLVIIELFISIKRLLIVHNITTPSPIRFGSVMMVCSLTAFISTVPILMAFKINPVDDHLPTQSSFKVYRLSFEKIERNKALKIVLALPGFFRGLIFPFVLLILNLQLWSRFRKQFKRKQRLQGAGKSRSYDSDLEKMVKCFRDLCIL